MKHWPNRISTVIAVGLSEIASKYPADGEKLINSLNKTFVVLDEAVKNLASDSDPRSPAIMNLLGQSTSEGISKSKSELLDTFKKVRDELTNLKDNSSSRLFLARGRHVNETLAAVKVDDPEKKMIITDKLMRSSSINQIQTLIHETVHLTRHSDDYRYSPLKYDIELTGGRVNRENTEKSLNDQQDVLAAMYQTPEEQFTKKNLADLQKGGGPKRSYSSMARDAGERPRSGTKICDLAKNSESFRRMIGLNNPDTIAALASAYGREALLHHEGAVEKPTLRPINPDIETNDFERKSAERAARRALREAEHQAALLELQHLTDRAAQQLADPDKMDIQTKLWLDTFINEEPHSDYSDKNLLHPEFDQLFLPCDPDNDPPDDELEEMTATAAAARFSDAKLLDPRFSQSYVPDQDDMDVYNAMDVQHCRDDFRQTPTVSGALDLIERLQHVTSDVQRNAVTDPELLRPLAKLALLSDTSRGRGYGAEVAEPIRYAATLTRDLLRQDQLSPERTAQLWFGQADCPAQILLPVRLIHAASQASRGVYVDLMADILSHPNLSQAQLHAITTAVKTHLPALSKEPLVGTRDAHQRLLREMADAGLSITKRRGMFSGGLGITVHATAPTHRPPAPADYLNRVDVDALRTGLGRRLDHLQALEAGDYAGTSGVVVSDRWRTLQHDKEIRRLNANYQRENIGQRLEGQNQWLADQSKFQKKVYTQESRRKLAEAEQQASLRRRQDAAVWEAEHAQRTHAIMDRVAEKRQAAKQQQAIETRANVESAIHGYRSVSDAPVRGLPSTPALLAVGGPDPLAGSLTLPTSTFAPMYEIGDKSIMIQALNRQGQPIRVEVPSSPTQGSGIVVNYRQGSSPSPLLSTGSGTSAPTRYHAPVVDALYHHERSGLPVLTLKNARGDTFSAASFQGFTLHTEQGLHTTTYNRVEPGTSTQQRMLQRTPAAPAMPPPPVKIVRVLQVRGDATRRRRIANKWLSSARTTLLNRPKRRRRPLSSGCMRRAAFLNRPERRRRPSSGGCTRRAILLNRPERHGRGRNSGATSSNSMYSGPSRPLGPRSCKKIRYSDLELPWPRS
ncbi:hypothetical protein C4K03_4722 [Pseudomonas synxantha]|uniref:Uncharacterized protein n=2 Tax=Pseudomonas synxantha TaxID=47883 RepID=A0A3G7UBY9_9PSED|nr:hypothetical protein C4K03_4722 [Pseudomonas synxantha]